MNAPVVHSLPSWKEDLLQQINNKEGFKQLLSNIKEVI